MALVTFDVLSFLKAWGSIQDRSDEAGARAFRASVKKALETQKEFGYQNQTGQMTRSMRWRMWQGAPYAYRGHVLTTTPYAKYVDEGTRPHKIRARNAPYLVFFWPKVGRWMRLKEVNHPGFKGAGFSAAAIQSFGQTAPLEIEKAIGAAANK